MNRRFFSLEDSVSFDDFAPVRWNSFSGSGEKSSVGTPVASVDCCSASRVGSCAASWVSRVDLWGSEADAVDAPHDGGAGGGGDPLTFLLGGVGGFWETNRTDCTAVRLATDLVNTPNIVADPSDVVHQSDGEERGKFFLEGYFDMFISEDIVASYEIAFSVTTTTVVTSTNLAECCEDPRLL